MYPSPSDDQDRKDIAPGPQIRMVPLSLAAIGPLMTTLSPAPAQRQQLGVPSTILAIASSLASSRPGPAYPEIAAAAGAAPARFDDGIVRIVRDRPTFGHASPRNS